MSKGGYVYILTNQPNGTLYLGVTNDLVRRVFEHREAGTSPAMTWTTLLLLIVVVLLLPEHRPDVVPQFDLGAVAVHDEALLQHRQRVVPGPVDHEARGE